MYAGSVAKTCLRHGYALPLRFHHLECMGNALGSSLCSFMPTAPLMSCTRKLMPHPQGYSNLLSIWLTCVPVLLTPTMLLIYNSSCESSSSVSSEPCQLSCTTNDMSSIHIFLSSASGYTQAGHMHIRSYCNNLLCGWCCRARQCSNSGR